jgi:hypothetical protein
MIRATHKHAVGGTRLHPWSAWQATLACFVIGTLESGFAADAAVRPRSLKIDKAALADATVQLDLQGHALKGLRLGLSPLVAGRDYVVQGEKVVLRKAFLEGLTGKATLVFDCGGVSPSLLVSVGAVAAGASDVTIDPPGGVFGSQQYVIISSALRTKPGLVMRYTTDGSEPTEKSRKVGGDVIAVGRSLTLKARSYLPDQPPGVVAEAAFIVDASRAAQAAAQAEKAGDPRPGAGSYEVYVGSAFYMQEMLDRSGWSYVADTADGLYHRFMGVDPLGAEGKKALASHFRSRKAIMEGGIREERHINQDQEWIAELRVLGLTPVATFVNGLNLNHAYKPNPPADLEGWWLKRIALNQQQGVASYTMQAPHRVCREGGWGAAVQDQPKRLTLACAGTSADAPTTLFMQLDDTYRQGVVDIIRWTHQQGRKFMFILSPNESPDTFNSDTVAIARYLEDRDAAPDIYGVTLYGKRPLHLVPESERGPDGRPVAASTLTGGAYYLLKHARADGGELDLWAADGRDRPFGRGAACEDALRATPLAFSTLGDSFALHIGNRSSWVDFIPTLCARTEGLPAGTTVQVRLGAKDITAQVFSRSGYCFYRDERLLPGAERALAVRIVPKPPVATGRVIFEVRPYPRSVFVRDVLVLGEKSGEPNVSPVKTLSEKL